MKNTCENCARLLKIINTDNKFCVNEKGLLYIVGNSWYKENNCNEKVDKFYLIK